MHYVGTSKGLGLLSKKSYQVFRDLIFAFVEDIWEKGYDGAMLIGSSKVNFMVEWACRKLGVDFIIDDIYDKRMALIHSEAYIPDRENIRSYFLQKLFLKVRGIK